jgi:hypothetical protein
MDNAKVIKKDTLHQAKWVALRCVLFTVPRSSHWLKLPGTKFIAYDIVLYIAETMNFSPTPMSLLVLKIPGLHSII